MLSRSSLPANALTVALGLLLCAAPAAAPAQTTPPKPAGGGQGAAAPQPAGSKTGRALYEEAASYARLKFEELQAKQVPYNELLRQNVLHEQRELAAANAAALAARPGLAGEDIYYAGLLFQLAGRGPSALDAMRRFLASAPAAPPPFRQKARAVLAEQAVQAELFAEAEAALAEYGRCEPRVPAEMSNIRGLLANAYSKKKEYARAAEHARAAFNDALATASDTRLKAGERATAVYGPGAFLAQTLAQAGRREESLAVVQQLRAVALGIPSARLFGDASRLLSAHGLPPDAPAEPAAAAPAAPELKINEWIDQPPTTLAQLRGRVVLLDFWATWCGPCRVTIPKLNALHRKHKDEGLVIIGLTEYYGHAQGRPLTPPEELDYLRRFKREHQIAYGFGVSDHEENGFNYGVASIPTAVLIDRRGRVRFITVTGSDADSRALARMVEKLVAEKP